MRLWHLDERDGLLPAGEPLLGHDLAVYGVAFSPSGTLVASGGNDNTVRAWDVRTSQARDVLPHPQNVQAVRFLSTDDELAAVGDDGALRCGTCPAPASSTAEDLSAPSSRWRATGSSPARATARSDCGTSPTRSDRPRQAPSPPDPKPPSNTWRPPATARSSPYRSMTAGSSSGTPTRRGSRCDWPPSRTPTPVGPSPQHSARTADCWRPAAATRGCGSGTSPIPPRRPPSAIRFQHDPVRSSPWPSAPTGTPWPLQAARALPGSTTCLGPRPPPSSATR